MKIAYITEYDANDINQWSGLGYFIAQTLRDQGFELQLIGNLKINNYHWHYLKKAIIKKIAGKNYRANRQIHVAKYFAHQIKKRVEPDIDLIFAPSSIPVSCLNTQKPIVFYTDATLQGMIDFYPEYKAYDKLTIRCGHELERCAMKNASLAIYSSDWAANSAINEYGCDPEKIRVLPFGANIEINLTEKEIVQQIDQRIKDNIIRLLFLGVYWERKGGDVALQIAGELVKMGKQVELNIVGYTPDQPLPHYVKTHGFVSKKTAEGKAFINELLQKSHLMLLPTRADCTPIVFSEANAFALPCISTTVGGIPSIITDGINGFLFDVDAPAVEYARKIVTIIEDKEGYKNLAWSSHKQYLDKLNWKVIGNQLKEYLQVLVQK